MKIRKSTEKDFQRMMNIAKKLHPKWFDNFAINRSIPLDLKIHKGFVIEEEGKILGFITYASNEGEVKISWMGILPDYQKKGIGTKLLKTLEKELKKMGIKELRVETLADSVKYRPYDSTRDFYRETGFKLEKVKKMKSKGTGKKFDMAVLLKKLK